MDGEEVCTVGVRARDAAEEREGGGPGVNKECKGNSSFCGTRNDYLRVLTAESMA